MDDLLLFLQTQKVIPDLQEKVSDSLLDKNVGGEKIKDVKEINNKQ